MTTGLLVIDVQRGLCSGENRPYEAPVVIQRINGVAELVRAAGGPVIFVQHESGPGYLEYGTEPWQLADGLRPGPTDLRVRKSTPDSFHGTDLLEILRTTGVTDLVICGMHTEFCVDTTTRRALAEGYPVVLVADAHTTEDKPHLSAALIIRHHK